MGEAHYQPVRLVRLEITNFKAIDRLEIDLPTPLTSMDPDVLVLGSRNGLGKTSVLEACAMLFVSSRAAQDDRGNISSSNFGVQLAVNPFDLLIRGGGDQARLSADFAVGGQRYQLVVSLSSDGQWKAGGDKDELSKALHPSGQRRSGITQLLWALLGLSADPFVAPPFLYFHSYRKVQEATRNWGRWWKTPTRGILTRLAAPTATALVALSLRYSARSWARRGCSRALTRPRLIALSM